MNTKFMLGDDGTLDTVIECRDCGAEMRYNFQGYGDIDSGDLFDDAQAYDAFVDQCIEDANDNHVCGEDT